MRRAGLLVVLLLAGCPAAPPVRTLARITAEELPADPVELGKYADEAEGQGDSASLEDALVARDKSLALDGKSFDQSWKAARTAFRIAEEAVGDAAKPRRAKFSEKGVEYAKRALSLDGKRVEGHYYLAVNLGLLASTRTWDARGMLGPIVEESKTAIAIDEKYHHAGPRRLLGAVLLRAPSWPAGPGDVEEGAEHLGKAVALDGAYPLNRLYYCEALMKNDRPDEARKECEAVLRSEAAAEWARDLPRWRSDAEELLRKMRR